MSNNLTLMLNETKEEYQNLNQQLINTQKLLKSHNDQISTLTE